MTDQKPTSSTLDLKLILKPAQSATTPSIDQLSYAEYDAFKIGIKLSEEMKTLQPTMEKFIDHTFDPTNIEYMKEAMLLPYPTSTHNKTIIFSDTLSVKDDKIQDTNITLQHILLKLHAGLFHRLSQKELGLLQDTSQIAKLQ